MASLKFTDAFFSFNSVDLSDFVKGITLTYEAEALDETAMGDTTRVNLGGLKNWSADVEFNQDFAGSATDVSLFSRVGETQTIIIRPTSSSVGATNPNYTGTALLQRYRPFGNAVGDLATASISLVSAGALSRATS